MTKTSNYKQRNSKQIPRFLKNFYIKMNGVMKFISFSDELWEGEIKNNEMFWGFVIMAEKIIETNKLTDKYKLVVEIPSYWKNKDEFFIIVDEDIKYPQTEVLKIKQKKYGLNTNFNLFCFNTAYFIQGIFSACKTFNEDYRDYIVGFPFDKNGIFFEIKGYLYPRIEMNYHLLDTYDEDIEDNLDNENLENPYRNFIDN